MRNPRNRKGLTLLPAIMLGMMVSGIVGPSEARAECRADFDANFVVDPDDLFAFLDAWFVGAPAADFDGNAQVDPDDLFGFLDAWFAGCPVELRASPLTAQVGDVITVQIVYDSAGAYQFDANSELFWSAQFVPIVGDPSAVFSGSFSAAQVLETPDPHTAKIVVGTGTNNVPSTVFSSDASGVLSGLLFATTSSGLLVGEAEFIAPGNVASWRMVEYPDGVGGLAAPTAGASVSQLTVYPLSLSPNAADPSAVELVYGAVDFHLMIQFSIPWSGEAAASAPSTVTVSLKSIRSNGTVIDTASGVSMTRGALQNGIPIVYSTLVTKPILLVDEPGDYTGINDVTILVAEEAGKILLTP